MFACEAVAAAGPGRRDHLGQDPHPARPASSGEGVGIVEAPRGILTHHYKTDEKGFITEANLIVGTTNNNAAISMSIKKVGARA